jgi:hypothetical protein
VRKIRQSEQKQRIKTIEIKGTSDKTAPKRNSNNLSTLERESQRKGKLTQKKGKQTDEKNREINTTKIKLLRNSKCKTKIP